MQVILDVQQTTIQAHHLNKTEEMGAVDPVPTDEEEINGAAIKTIIPQIIQ